MFTAIHDFLDPLRRLQAQIRDAVVAACETVALEALSAVAQEEAGDTIYAVDRVIEEVLVDFFAREVAAHIAASFTN